MASALKWPDEKQVPSDTVVKDLLAIGKTILSNARAMTAIQEAHTKWGRNTLFDDYTKLTAIMHKIKGAGELAMIVETLVENMKRATPSGKEPENPTRTSLTAKSGELAMAWSCLEFLFQHKPPSSWQAM